MPIDRSLLNKATGTLLQKNTHSLGSLLCPTINHTRRCFWIHRGISAVDFLRESEEKKLTGKCRLSFLPVPVGSVPYPVDMRGPIPSLHRGPLEP